MAFNLQTFKTRALTAIVFAVVMMGGLLLNRWSFFILFSIVHFGAWIEYQKLISSFNKDFFKAISIQHCIVMLVGWCLLLFFTNQQLQLFGAHLTTIGWWLGLAMLIITPLLMLVQSPKSFLITIGYSTFWNFVCLTSPGINDRFTQPLEKVRTLT